VAALTQFYPLIEPFAPGCPRPLILQQLMALLQDFFSFSRIWTEDISLPGTPAGSYPMTLTPPAGARILQVRSIHVVNPGDGVDVTLYPKDRDYLRVWSPDYLTLVGPDPFWFYTTGQATFGLVPSPNDVLDLTPNVALSIAYDGSATSIPDEFFDEYSDGIARGVVARLLLMTEKPWSNPQLAGSYAASYVAARGNAKLAAQADFNNAPMQVSLRRRF
jgi:hypothetical protein